MCKKKLQVCKIVCTKQNSQFNITYNYDVRKVISFAK